MVAESRLNTPQTGLIAVPSFGRAREFFTLKTRAGGGEKKRKQRRHPGCQSAINWIAFQAKLWGWSMARKRLSARLRLLLGCVCVCAYENESWHERLFCLAAAQWCKPLETAPLFFVFFSGSASSRLRTLAETLDKPGRPYSPCYEPATSLCPPSNQWLKGGRIKSATSATYADDILLYSSFMWSFVFPSQSANQYSYLLRNQSKGWEMCWMDLLDIFIFISILYIYYVYLSLVTWHRGSFQSYNCETDNKKCLWVFLIRVKGQWQPLFGAQHSSILFHVVTIVQIWCFGLWQTVSCSTFPPKILSVNQTDSQSNFLTDSGEKMLGCTISHPKPSKSAPTFFLFVVSTPPKRMMSYIEKCR